MARWLMTEVLVPYYYKRLPACPEPHPRFYRISGIEMAYGYGYRVLPEQKTFLPELHFSSGLGVWSAAAERV